MVGFTELPAVSVKFGKHCAYLQDPSHVGIGDKTPVSNYQDVKLQLNYPHLDVILFILIL